MKSPQYHSTENLAERLMNDWCEISILSGESPEEPGWPSVLLPETRSCASEDVALVPSEDYVVQNTIIYFIPYGHHSSDWSSKNLIHSELRAVRGKDDEVEDISIEDKHLAASPAYRMQLSIADELGILESSVLHSSLALHAYYNQLNTDEEKIVPQNTKDERNRILGAVSLVTTKDGPIEGDLLFAPSNNYARVIAGTAEILEHLDIIPETYRVLLKDFNQAYAKLASEPAALNNQDKVVGEDALRIARRLAVLPFIAHVSLGLVTEVEYKTLNKEES